MVKIAGVLLVLAGTSGYGRYLCLGLERYEKQLFTVRNIFGMMQCERAGRKLPYAQILKYTAKKAEEPFGTLLTEIAQEMEKNREDDVGALWKWGMEKHRKELLLQEEERELMVMFAQNFASDDEGGKLSQICFSRLDERIMRMAEEKKEKQKLYRMVSMLGGIFLVILLL